MLWCSRCGADLLIPLSFTLPYPGAREQDLPPRPTFKCVVCKRPLYPGDVVRSEEAPKRR
jgi:hypothetical protein